MKKITQAFVLVAGVGTRLRPLTDTCPKPMVPINGVPLLERTVMLLKAQGCSEFIFNVYHLPDVIRNHFGDGSRFGVSVRYSDETGALLETAGALKKAESLLHEDFLFLYGDHLHTFDFAPAIALHRAHGAAATVVLKNPAHSTDPSTADIVEINPTTNRVIRCYPRPHTVTALSTTLLKSGGLYVLSKRVIKDIPHGMPVRLDRDVIPRLVVSGETVLGFPTEDAILDIGTLEKYRYAEEWYKKRQEA